jgi:hypothetical protein
MSVRFRIRTPAGQELSFGTAELFERFVRAGDLSMDDLVYDAEIGSWSSAMTHPLVLQIEMEREAAKADAEDAAGASVEGPEKVDEVDPEAAKEEEPSVDNAFGLSLAAPPPGREAPGEDVPSDEPEGVGSDDAHGDARGTDEPADEAPATGGEGSGLGLDLAPAVERSAADEERAFLEELEAEREAEMDIGGSSSRFGGLTREDSGRGTELTPALPPAPPPAPPPSPPRPTGASAPSLDPASPRRSTGKVGGWASPDAAGSSRRGWEDDEPEDKAPAKRAEKHPPKRSRGPLLAVVVVMVMVGIGAVYFVLTRAGSVVSMEGVDAAADSVARSEPPQPQPEAEPEPEPEPEPLEAVIPSSEAAVRERAQERFLSATQLQLRDLPPIPEAWPGGAYFALPSDYPEVAEVWRLYGEVVQRIRDGDDERYAEAYRRALDDAAVVGDVRELRLSSALTDFEADAAARSAHYDRVAGLASVALRVHASLVEAEGLILHDASGSTGVAGSVGGGTSGRNADAEATLEALVGLIDEAIEAEGFGPRAGTSIREWIWDGIIEAVTN